MFRKFVVWGFFIALAVLSVSMLVLMGSMTLSDLNHWPLETTWDLDGYVLTTSLLALGSMFITGPPLLFFVFRDSGIFSRHK